MQYMLTDWGKELNSELEDLVAEKEAEDGGDGDDAGRA